MIRSVSLLIILSFFAMPLIGQSFIEGVVINEDTEEPVPYVNIGIIKKMKGTVSSFEGNYQLSFTDRSDTVTFSSIGYERKHVAIVDLIDKSNVRLKPEVYQGEEIVVTGYGYGPIKNFGYKLDQKGQSVGYGNNNLGAEIGALINFKRETRIESAHFAINFTGGDSLKYRVNLYQMENGKPGDNLLKENIIIKGAQERGTISADLSHLDLLVKGEVLLSLEWVDKGITDINNGVMFRSAKTNRRRANAWMKFTSFAPYQEMQYVKYKLGFYLMGKELLK